MKKSANTFVILLIGILIAAVAVQGVFLAKLYRQTKESPRQAAVAEPLRMDLKPNAAGPSAAAQSPGAIRHRTPLPPFGGFGFDPDTWDPFQELRSMRQQMDQMFNNSFGRFRMSPGFQSLWSGTPFSPSMDVEEQDDRYIVRMDIPGAEKSGLSVTIEDRQLNISGQVDETVEEKNDHMLRKERRTGRFERSVQLPGSVKADEMTAEYKDGVLTVTVPKGAESERSKTITIQ